MKYTYAYKTSDGTRHEASMNAESREAVFAALRKQGIKAIKVVAADGSKANGEIRGVRTKVVVLLVALAAVAAGVVAFVGGARSGGARAAELTNASPRHQIYGDPDVMAKFERGDFAQELSREGDILLAWFAEPGRLMCPPGADPRRLTAQQLEAFVNYIRTDLSVEDDLDIAQDMPRESAELRQIVNGMRAELRAYLANGNGTPKSFWRRLVSRTMQEMQIYERTRKELENEKDSSVWERKNDALRLIGIRTIANEHDGVLTGALQ